MPFLLERARAKRLTEGEMRAIFDEIDTDRSGSVGRAEFVYMFCGKLGLLSQEEAEAVLSVLDRYDSRKVSPVFFFLRFFFAAAVKFCCVFASDTALDRCASRQERRRLELQQHIGSKRFLMHILKTPIYDVDTNFRTRGVLYTSNLIHPYLYIHHRMFVHAYEHNNLSEPPFFCQMFAHVLPKMINMC